ncbi:HutD family protein [Pseudomonas cavernae]|uniref:HutD family protein n=1 Tax=Pseudomonas cavernae TaxID=2320867 RepID=A0A385Z1G9_9PSED|nr:HutD family protein [Pseudomonas cavernae]AYC33049.1 HutD family protein [Pseudomonas cavernae]
MTRTQTHRAADYPRMPWKNGAGSTLEIARDGGASLDSFGWRLSIADVGEAGGFSAFNGYQRIITVLEGGGMQLQVDGRLSRPLLALEPFAFAGDSQVDCRLLAGAIRDFNLIYSPDRYLARLQWLALEQPQRLFSSAPTLLLFSAADGLEVRLDAAACPILGRYDCLHFEREPGLAELQIQAASAGSCCLIELTPR